MRLYVISIEGVLRTIHAQNASVAVWCAIEEHINRYNKKPNEVYAVGYYTKSAHYVPLLDGRKGY